MCLRAKRRLSDLIRGSRAWAADHRLGIREVVRIVGTALGKRKNTRNRSSPTACSTGALLIVLPERWNGSKANSSQRADVDSNLHRVVQLKMSTGGLSLPRGHILKA